MTSFVTTINSRQGADERQRKKLYSAAKNGFLALVHNSSTLTKLNWKKSPKRFNDDTFCRIVTHFYSLTLLIPSGASSFSIIMLPEIIFLHFKRIFSFFSCSLRLGVYSWLNSRFDHFSNRQSINSTTVMRHAMKVIFNFANLRLLFFFC